MVETTHDSAYNPAVRPADAQQSLHVASGVARARSRAAFEYVSFQHAAALSRLTNLSKATSSSCTSLPQTLHRRPAKSTASVTLRIQPTASSGNIITSKTAFPMSKICVDNAASSQPSTPPPGADVGCSAPLMVAEVEVNTSDSVLK
mmetsp:Transcript_26278/g.66291  ORF Transcript_26278/g.66291 Transcript_26278/m.66291 type:complete len:147 (+) Transcript_26278:1018-1458(+)